MTIYLGVDGGGSTCRARAVDARGQVVGEGLAGPANVASDPAGSLAAILEAARAALGAVPFGQVVAGLGLAGANDAGAARTLQDRLPFGQALVRSDGFISTLGALGSGDGIVAAIGTGSIFIRQLAGQQHEIGGRGLVLGDEASGAWMGRKLLSLTLRAQDGFRPMTSLLRQTLHDFGGAEAVMSFSITARPSDFAGLTPRLVGLDDPAARAILDEAVRDCLEAVGVLQAGKALPVVCLGGLAPVFSPFLAERHNLVPPKGTALDGAVSLAQGLRPDRPV